MKSILLLTFIPSFVDNFIDEEAFMLFDDSTIKEIITPVGQRMKFMANLKNFCLEDEGGHNKTSSAVIAMRTALRTTAT